MPKHSGCALCGSMEDEILESVPLLFNMTSIALCKKCHALPADEIKRQFVALEQTTKAAMAAARSVTHASR